MRLAFLNSQPWKGLSRLILISSAALFFLLIALVSMNSLLLYPPYGVDMTAFSVALSLALLLFPLWIGATLSAKSRLNPAIAVLLGAVFVAAFAFVVPVIPVPETFGSHCPGTFTGYQSVSYHLFGFGWGLHICCCL